jgi:hypothetical protein
MIDVDMNDINAQIDDLLNFLHTEIVIVLGNDEVPSPEKSFVVAGALADLVGWYSRYVNEISHSMEEKFQSMIASRIYPVTPLN